MGDPRKHQVKESRQKCKYGLSPFIGNTRTVKFTETEAVPGVAAPVQGATGIGIYYLVDAVFLFGVILEIDSDDVAQCCQSD